MNGVWKRVLFTVVGICGVMFGSKSIAQSGLQVAYGSKGVQTISYGGVVLDDVGAYPQDAFHIWHMKSTDLNGNLLTNGGYGWGESNYGESWNAQTRTETYTFSWGSVATQFVQNGNNLDMLVTETNNPGSGVIFDGAEIYPFAFHFPQDPVGFYGYNQFAITTTGPGVSVADFGSGVVTSVVPNETLAIYGGWKSQGNSTYSPIMTGTAPDGLATFLPKNDQPVQPGSSLTYTVSLRFTPEGTAANASDAYSSFAATYPSQMTWVDKRIIGTAYLASSPSNLDITQPGGFPTNPRRYFNDGAVDITTASGLRAFQSRMLAQAANNVSTAQSLNAQGVITWDIEGEQYPQSTSYVCSPDQIATVAPEMESIISDASSGYYGQKLDDAYFRTMSSAGLKIGVCLRPQVFTFAGDGTASQVYLSGNAKIIANLEAKASYANTRWGATIFYVDSTVDTSGGTLDPAIFQQLITDYPSFLFVPEESTPRYYAYSAPFYSFLASASLGTPTSTYNFYPSAFGANMVNDASAGTLATYTPQLTQAVKRGDILMGHADYWQANDPTLVSIYQAAGVGAGKPQVTPVITWPAVSSIAYGTALSGAQLDASATVPGSFVYSPAAGTVLNAGVNTLLLTFSPTDTVNYKTATASTNVTVTPVAPVIQWSTPSSIVYGTALSSAQLNASASISGSFSYTPAAGTVPQVGNSTLNVVFTPASTNYTSGSASTNLTVTQVPQATPVVNWAVPASITYGTPLTGAQLNASANVSGTFTYVPAAGTILNAGITTLSATFTPTDTVNYKAATVSTYATVLRATPSIQWPVPASIPYGTALSSAQLNASANTVGSFVYTPAAGSVPAVGSSTLNVTFTPANGNNYTSASASTSLTVTQVPQAVPKVSWATPASIPYGTALTGAQLNATANVPGIFVYTPSAGAMMSAGTATLSVTFTPTDTISYKSAVASVSLTVTQAMPAVQWATPSNLVYGTALSATQLNASANLPGSFSYTPAAGTVLNAGVSILVATFTPTDVKDYTTATASTHVTVSQITPVINWSAPPSIVYGTALSGAQLNASANVPGSFSYTPAAGTIPSAGNNTLVAIFTPANTTNYSSVSVSVDLIVTQPVQSVPQINWALPAGITYGTALSATQLNATANVAGSFAYSPAAGSVPGAGVSSLAVTFTPTDTTHYKAVSATVSLSVARATPVLTWAAPPAMVSGTALSGAQLDATANVPGSLAYSPSAGTVLSTGTMTLQATFIPADQADYNMQSASVSLTVAAAPPTVYLALTWPVAGQTVSGTINAIGYVNLFLDSAGSFLMVDGRPVSNRRITSAPYVYPLDTTGLSNGPHVLRLWAHDISNNTTITAPITVVVAN